MNWRDQIQQWSQWPGWRTHAPAAGSVVAHIAVVGVFAGLMATVAAEGAPRAKPERRIMVVELIQPPAPVEAGVTPPPMPKTEPRPDRSAAPLGPADKRKTNAPAPSDQPLADDDTFYTGPPVPQSEPGLAQGLASLMGDDPCAVKRGPKPKECAGRELAKRTGRMDSVMPVSPQQQAKFYGEFMEKCPYWSGCDGEYLRSSNGTRSVAKGAPGSGGDRDQPAMMAGGAATLGGLNATTGRLGFNPDFRDRGFGD